MAVDLDGVEAVVRPQVAEDLPRDRPGAGAHLQDPAGTPRPAEFRDEGPGQKSAAGQKGSRGADVPPIFAEKAPALRPVAHPRCLTFDAENRLFLMVPL